MNTETPLYQRYTLHGLEGSIDFGFFQVPRGRVLYLHNSVYLCPHCGFVWGSVVHWKSETELEPDVIWQPITRLCESCGGGEFYNYLYDLALPEFISGKLLRREFELATRRKHTDER